MMPETGPEAASMDQAAGEAMRMAAELVAVGTMAIAQRTRKQERTTETERQRVLRETRTSGRLARNPSRDDPSTGVVAETPDVAVGDTPADLAVGDSVGDTAPAAEGLDRTQELPRVEVDPDATAPLPVVRADPPPQADARPATGPVELPAVAAAERVTAASLASSPSAQPAEVARALVDVGAQPVAAESLGTAVAKAAAQPKPTRSANLGRSPLPGHDLSR
jgi:hypothetical protein